jgi:hypothetical protein
MSAQDIVDCMEVIKTYNPNMGSLYDTFFEQAPGVEDDKEAVASAFENGYQVYETLITVNVDMANAIHDYTYNVINPFDSIMVKNIIREQICREVYGIEASF